MAETYDVRRRRARRPGQRRPPGSWRGAALRVRRARAVRARARARRLARHVADHPAQLPHARTTSADLRGLRRLGRARGRDRRALRDRHRWPRPVPARRGDPRRRLHRVDGRGRRRRTRCWTSPPSRDRWPQFALPDGTVGRLPGSAPASCPRPRGHGRDAAPGARRTAPSLRDRHPGRPRCATSARRRRRGRRPAGRPTAAGGVVVTADAWTNDVLAPLGVGPAADRHPGAGHLLRGRPDPQRFAADRFPVWIWMDDPSFYGFPTYGEATVKAAQDCGGPAVTGDDALVRRRTPAAGRAARPSSWPGRSPAPGRPIRSKTLPVHADAGPGLRARPRCPGTRRSSSGSAPPTASSSPPMFGRLLADLAVTGAAGTTVDLTPFRLDRPALTDADHPVSWLV